MGNRRGIPDRDNLYKLANILGVTVNDMHQIIRSMKYKDIDLTVNITPDIIEFSNHMDIKYSVQTSEKSDYSIVILMILYSNNIYVTQYTEA